MRIDALKKEKEAAHTTAEVISQLKKMAKPENVEGMARFGINPDKTLGVPVPALRSMARDIGRDHSLALGLWASGIHDARILASMIDEHEKVTEKQMEAWAKDFDSWDVVDQTCMNLFDKTEHAHDKAVEWSVRDEEFVKRAGFSLMAVIAFHDKKAKDDDFSPFFSMIVKGSTDERNFVKKAVNWALRQIGKRNLALNGGAIRVAEKISKIDSKAARWIAADALRELKGEAVQKRLRAKED